MLPWFTERFGNAGSRTHSYGLEARSAVELAREQVGALVGASPKEVLFTSGATEANNLAVLGALRAAGSGERHVVCSGLEHKAVLDAAHQLEREGVALTVVNPGADGVVDPQAILAALRPETVLVSVMLANNEVGTVQPVADIAAACRERGVLVHTDAVQATAWMPLDMAALGVDLMSLTAHKMYGPKGIGALVVRRGRPRVHLEPLVYGGGQERGLRSGTLPVPMIVGFGAASVGAYAAVRGELPTRVRARRERLWQRLHSAGEVVLHGSVGQRLPGNLLFSAAGVEAEALIMSLRTVVACSSGSACSSETLEPSHVLTSMGVPPAIAHGAVRLGLGWHTTDDEVEQVADAFVAKIAQLRDLASVGSSIIPR